MQKQPILIISVLMAVSLFGVIGLQGYWLKQTMDQAAKEFDQRANRALYAAVGNFAQSEMELIISEEINEAIDWRNLVSETDSLARENSFSNFEFHQSYEGVGSGDLQIISKGNTVVFVGSSDSATYDITEQYEDAQLDYEVVRGEYDVIQSEFEVIEDAFRTVLVRTISKQEDINRRLENADIEPVLATELQKEGIDLPFVYAVTTDSILPVYSSSLELDEMNYEVNMFSDEKESPLLHLGFQNRGAYILKNTGDVLGLVCLFTLLLMGSAVYAIRFMLNQKRLAEMKSDFINNMTHEFKTPLATIGLAADSIKHPRVRENQDEVDRYSNIITSESRRLNSHVESILQLAKMERGEVNLKKSMVRINELLEEAVMANQMRIEQYSAEVNQVYMDDEAECFVDSYHVINALSNLIDNAIKYSKDSPIIDLAVQRRNGQIEFTVADRGIGMSTEAKKRAFEPFYREQSGNLHDVKGFGVGLSYVKEIAEGHGGSVEIDSKKGRGTTVMFRIPCNEG